MEWIAIVTVLALLQFSVFSFQVGMQRQKHGVKAPAMGGHPEFERAMRVQQNTMEQLVVFIPALWLYGWLVNPVWGAAIGAVFIIARQIYRSAYMSDPATRSLGFTAGFLATVVLLIWSLATAIYKLF